jgi:leucyl aminopeptidase (aminopeptidase T)
MEKSAGWKMPKDYMDENMVREDGIGIDGVEVDKCCH